MPVLSLKNIVFQSNDGEVFTISQDFYIKNSYVINAKDDLVIKQFFSKIMNGSSFNEGKILWKNISLADFDPVFFRKSCISVLLPKENLVPFLSVKEYLRFVGAKRKQPLLEGQKNIGEKLLERFHFPEEKMNRKIKMLTQEEQLVLCIAKLCSKECEILIVDRFFDHWDREIKVQMLSFLTAFAEEAGKCLIILSGQTEWEDLPLLNIQLTELGGGIL